MSRVAELFAGYGGLGMGVARAIPGTELAWYSEFDAAPSRIMAHHHPGVPNHGDVTAIDWSRVERPDILTGGFPCQDVSVAGRRAGMVDGTRSGLWSHMAHAIDQLRPALVVIENVGGLFSAEADRIVESHPICLGADGSGFESVPVRALPAVLSTLCELGYDAQWTTLRAADVGAPHGRLRVFITAHPAGKPFAPHTSGGGGSRGTALPVTGGEEGQDTATVGADPRPDAPGSAAGLTLLPTPAAARAGRQRSASAGAAVRPTLDSIHQLLPTPSANIAANGGSQDPTKRRAGGHQPSIQDVAEHTTDWGVYAPVIARWEHVTGRPAPAPTEPGKNRPRLSAAFVEWLMGLPDGHVTGVPGLTRNQQLKALGNGVVPQQAAAALAHLAHLSTL